MTIIVGLRAPDRSVWIGADSRVTADKFIFPEPVKKIVRHGDWRIGLSGSFHSVDLVRRKGQAISDTGDPHDVADVIQNLFKEAGYKQCTDHSGPPCFEQSVVLAHPFRGVFSVSGSGTVGVPEADFVAIGSGAEIAYGALFALRPMMRDPAAVVRTALEAACYYYACCGGELTVEHVGREHH